MNSGIKFCGGCNPRYDRAHVLGRIKEMCPEVDFEIAKAEKDYDIVIVIGGCTSCCASYEEYDIKLGVIKIRGEQDLEKAVNFIKQYETKHNHDLLNGGCDGLAENIRK